MPLQKKKRFRGIFSFPKFKEDVAQFESLEGRRIVSYPNIKEQK